MDNFDDFETEDFDEVEFERISKLRQRESLKAIEQHIAANKDERSKTVGDKVIVWDASRLTDIVQDEIDYDPKVHMILSTYPSIVVEDRCRYVKELITFTGDFSKNLDLIIWNKTLNKKFRTSSEFVRLYEPLYQ